MPTDKPRIQAYIEPQIHEKLKEFQQERGLKESPALNEILKEYFGVEPSQASVGGVEEIIGNSLKNFGQLIDMQLDAFQAQIDTLRQAQEQARDDLGKIQFLKLRIEALEKICQPIEGLAELSKPLEKGDIADEEQEQYGDGSNFVNLLLEVYPHIPPVSELPSKPPSELNLSQLARHFKISKSVISRRKSRPDFEEWSQATDPDGKTWSYDPERQIFRGVAL